jgi:hypothetical protein
MSSRTKATAAPKEPRYVGWRGELIAKLALTRAGLVVQDAPPTPPEPFDLLASTPDGFYFLVLVKPYSSMHGGRRPEFDRSHDQSRWPVESSVLRAAGAVNLPAVLFVIDADREVGHYARLDRLPHSSRDQRTTFVSLSAERDLSPIALAALVSELRQDWALARRPA